MSGCGNHHHHEHEHQHRLGAGQQLGGYSAAFADDDGSPDEELRRRLGQAQESGSEVDYLEAVAELCLSRLLVPLLAAGDETMEADPERHAEMSAVLLQHPDGRKAMLAFTGVDSMARWNAEARPVPATLDMVAEAALQSQAGTLLIDFEGPHPLVIDGEVLENLAYSRRLAKLNDGAFAWLVPDPQAAENAEGEGSASTEPDADAAPAQ